MQLVFSPIPVTKTFTSTAFFLLSAIFPITVESQHNFLRHRDLSRDLLTVSSIRSLEVENATFWSAKNIAKIFFGQNLFCSGVSYVLNNRKTRKKIRFSGTLNVGKFELGILINYNLIKIKNVYQELLDEFSERCLLKLDYS